MPWCAGAWIVLLVILAVTDSSDIVFLVAVLGLFTGAALYDAAKSRIKLQRWHEACGELPSEDDSR